MDFVFDSSLVLYLPFDDLDGASFMSRDAYGHLAAVTGAVWRPEGRSFDGGDDSIGIAASSALALTSQLTVEVSVKLQGTNPAQHETAVNLGIPANRLTFSARRNAGGNRVAVFNTTDSGWSESTQSLDRGEPYQLDFVCNSGRFVRFYTNGEFNVERSLAAFPALNGSVWTGWSGAGTEYFRGLIGVVRVYNRTLTPQEIQQNYLATKRRYR